MLQDYIKTVYSTHLVLEYILLKFLLPSSYIITYTFRFHLKKGTMNVHTLLQKMFQNELTEEAPDLSSIVTAEVTDAPKFEQFTQS